MTVKTQQAWREATNFALRIGEHISALGGQFPEESDESLFIQEQILPKQTEILSTLERIRNLYQKEKEVTPENWNHLFTKLEGFSQVVLQFRKQLEKHTIPYSLHWGLCQNFEQMARLLDALKFSHIDLELEH